MAIKLKVGGAIMSSAIAAVSFAFNAFNVKSDISWSWIAFISFLVFAGLVFWALIDREYRIKDLQKTLNDRSVQDAQQDHIKDIDELMKEWWAILVSPMPHNVVDADYSSSSLMVEDKPLFGDLKQHLTKPNLWQDYSTWKARRRQYLDTCKKLRSEIDDAWKIDGTEKAPAFANKILEVIDGSKKGLQLVLTHDPKHAEDVKYQRLLANGEYVVRGREVGSQGYFEESYDQCTGIFLSIEYQKVAESFFKRDEATKVKQLYDELKQLEAKMQESLEDISQRRSHKTAKCARCPIS